MAEETAAENAAPAANITEEAPLNAHGKPVIAVKVYAPFQVYYEGDAYSLSAINETGPFDILPHHHNFLCMLVPCTMTIRTLDGEKKIKVSRALMHVKADSVVVFMDV